jgi:hypothetical protein
MTKHLEREHKWWVLDNGNLIAGGPTCLRGGSNTILKIVDEPNRTPQNRFVRWGLPSLINTLLGHLLSDVGLFKRNKCQLSWLSCILFFFVFWCFLNSGILWLFISVCVWSQSRCFVCAAFSNTIIGKIDYSTFLKYAIIKLLFVVCDMFYIMSIATYVSYSGSVSSSSPSLSFLWKLCLH